MKKLFGGINLTWTKLIVFAAIAGVYTGVMAVLPAAKNTSFADISITFEWWVLFAMIIIMNCASAKGAGRDTYEIVEVTVGRHASAEPRTLDS